MTKAAISSKGQIAIPKAVRERLNLKTGTEVSIDVQGKAKGRQERRQRFLATV